MSTELATSQTLNVSIEEGIAEITLCRPEILNRFDRELHEALPDTLDALNGRDDVRAIVLASTGKVFSAGGDFELIKRSHEDLLARMESHERGKRRHRHHAGPQPVEGAHDHAPRPG